jgi:hypothetical protein
MGFRSRSAIFGDARGYRCFWRYLPAADIARNSDAGLHRRFRRGWPTSPFLAIIDDGRPSPNLMMHNRFNHDRRHRQK